MTLHLIIHHHAKFGKNGWVILEISSGQNQTPGQDNRRIHRWSDSNITPTPTLYLHWGGGCKTRKNLVAKRSLIRYRANSCFLISWTFAMTLTSKAAIQSFQMTLWIIITNHHTKFSSRKTINNPPTKQQQKPWTHSPSRHGHADRVIPLWPFSP